MKDRAQAGLVGSGSRLVPGDARHPGWVPPQAGCRLSRPAESPGLESALMRVGLWR